MAIGAAPGCGWGAGWGWGIPGGGARGLGRVNAGGLLMSVIASAGGAAAVGTILGALVGLGIPEHEAKYYEGEFHAGRTLVTVKAEGRAADAASILRSCGAYDMQSAGSRTGTTSGTT